MPVLAGPTAHEKAAWLGGSFLKVPPFQHQDLKISGVPLCACMCVCMYVTALAFCLENPCVETGMVQGALTSGALVFVEQGPSSLIRSPNL
jgi:hypothetical protein